MVSELIWIHFIQLIIIFLENEITIFIFLSVFIVFVLFKSKLLIKNIMLVNR